MSTRPPARSFTSTGQLVRRSPFGWYALAGDDRKVVFVTMGHATQQEAADRVQRECPEANGAASACLREAADQMDRYFAGEPVDLRTIPVRLEGGTAFQRRVVEALRRVNYGETITYGELATRAGAPRAARAVGTVMARNRTPLLVPCHRVIAAGGCLGGFSAAQGVSLKQALLTLESGKDSPRPRPTRKRPASRPAMV